MKNFLLFRWVHCEEYFSGNFFLLITSIFSSPSLASKISFWSLQAHHRFLLWWNYLFPPTNNKNKWYWKKSYLLWIGLLPLLFHFLSFLLGLFLGMFYWNYTSILLCFHIDFLFFFFGFILRMIWICFLNFLFLNPQWFFTLYGS